MKKAPTKSFNFGVKKAKPPAEDETKIHKKTNLDDDQEPSRKLIKLDNDDAATHATSAKKTGEEEEDPLEAFMVDVDTQLKQDESKFKKDPLRRDDLEEEDNVESYINAMKQKGVTLGQISHPSESDPNANSDDEVYATANAVDAAALDYDSDENPLGLFNPSALKKDIEPLSRIDHSTITYLEINKYFYEEHPEIAVLDSAKVAELRATWEMHVSGANVAKPVESFAHFNFDTELIREIQRNGYTTPTPIQKQAVPVALEGRDIIGIAKTGSGKTAAFVWPMLVHIMDQPELEKGDGPIGLILAPTRELASQIYTETKKFAKAYQLKVSAVYGGASKTDQFKELRGGGPNASGPEILVATPGRLIDLIKRKATNFKRVSFLVLDEADRMFDLGFESQVRSICDSVRPDRQTLLFSATFPPKIEKLARETTSDPVRINIGTVGQANEDITQMVIVMREDGIKWNWVVEHLTGLVQLGSVLIFVARIGGVDELAVNLRNAGFISEGIHGDMAQSERERVLKEFRQGKFNILVATDVASRGLDIKSVRTVINYDIARDIDSHTHRIGRTGRAGEKGTAYTLITEKEDKFAGELVRNLEQSGQIVPKELFDLAMRNGRFRSSREGWKGRGGKGGRGGRGRGRGRGGGGGGGNSTSFPPVNTVPMGQNRAGVGAQTKASDGNTSFSSSKYSMAGFQKATTDIGGVKGLRSVEETQQTQRTQQEPSHQRHGKRRWDNNDGQ